MSQTTKDYPGTDTHTHQSGCGSGVERQAGIDQLTEKPRKTEGQYLLVNESRGLSNQPEGEQSPTTATLNVNKMYFPSQLAGNWMDLDRS